MAWGSTRNPTTYQTLGRNIPTEPTEAHCCPVGLTWNGRNVNSSRTRGPPLNFNRKSTARDFMLDQVAIHDCIEIASNVVEVLSLMADVTRKEIQGFGHFMVWLRGRRSNNGWRRWTLTN